MNNQAIHIKIPGATIAKNLSKSPKVNDIISLLQAGKITREKATEQMSELIYEEMLKHIEIPSIGFEIPLKIVEGAASVWHYHLSETGKSGDPALCGEKKVMATSIPLSSWGQVSHLHESYCKDCERKLGERQ